MAIELEHTFAVPVPPEQAWDVLLDVARVAPCMPGATVDSVDGDVVTGKIKVKVGPIAMTYAGQATFTERDPAAHVVKMEASGKETRGAGTASATVHARLEEENGQTRVRVNTSLNVTGRPAQFGRGVMAEVGGKLIERFSANLAKQLAASNGPAPAQDQDAAAAEAPGAAAGQETAGQGAALGAAAEEAEGAVRGAAAEEAQDAQLAMPIQMLNLPPRSYNSLKGEGIDTVGELVARTEDDLLAIKNIGARSVREIEEKLGELGLALAEARPGHAAAASNGSRPAGSAVGGTGQDWAGEVPAVSGAGPVTPDAGPPEYAATGDDESMDDAINLLDVAAGPILKRALPAVGAAIVLVVIGIRLRRRRSAP